LTNGVEGKGRKSGKKKRNYASYYLCSTFPHALWPQRYTYLKSQPHNPNIFGVPYHASLDSSICAKCIFQPAPDSSTLVARELKWSDISMPKYRHAKKPIFSKQKQERDKERMKLTSPPMQKPIVYLMNGHG